jgi:hypothetical protein
VECKYIHIRYPSQSNNRHNGPTVRYTYLVTNLFIYGANSVMQVLILYNTTTTIAIYRYISLLILRVFIVQSIHPSLLQLLCYTRRLGQSQ